MSNPFFKKKLSNLSVLRYFQKQYTETCISLIQYALMTVSCKSIVYYHNQNHSIGLKSNAAIDTVKVELMSIAISHHTSWCCPIVLTTSSLYPYSPSIPETAYLNLLSFTRKLKILSGRLSCQDTLIMPNMLLSLSIWKYSCQAMVVTTSLVLNMNG